MAKHVPMKSKESLKQAVKFTLLSLSAGLIELISFTLLERISSLNYNIMHVISVSLSVLWNFTLNRRYTFKSANNVPIAMLKVAAFYVVYIPLSAYLGQIAANHNINEYLIKIPTMLVNFMGEFIWWKFVVFRGSENTNKLAEKKVNAAEAENES